MRTVERTYIESRLWTCLTSEFLEDVKRRYHYEKKDMEQLKRVASDMVSCLKGQESTYLIFPEEEGEKDSRLPLVTVIMTLGERVDMLQERYQKTDRMLESYMVESIGGELLMLGYRQLEAWIGTRTKYHVTAYHFPGSEETYPLEMIPELLERAGQRKVSCNGGFCLRPKKSVVFLMELSKEKTEGGVGICDTCSRKNSCPQRAGQKEIPCL